MRRPMMGVTVALAIAVLAVGGCAGGRMKAEETASYDCAANWTGDPDSEIAVTDGGDGKCALTCFVSDYRSVQTKVLGIPAGPKQLIGRSQYFRFLTDLRNGLRALDSSGQVAIASKGN